MSKPSQTLELKSSINAFSLRAGSVTDADVLNSIDYFPVVVRPSNTTSLTLSIDGVQGEKVSLWMTRSGSGFQSRPKAEVALLSVRLVYGGQMMRNNEKREFVSQVGQGIALPFEAMRYSEMAPGFESLSFCMSNQHLRTAFEDVEGRLAPLVMDFEPIVALDTLPLKAFASTLRNVYGRLSSRRSDIDLLYPLLEELMIYQFLSSWPMKPAATRPACLPAPSRVVRTAKDYIEAHLATPMTVAEIAKATATSVRVLQLTFRKEIDRTPIQYILERRLDRVHQDLLSGAQGLRIGQVAQRWGFNNASDFTQRYKSRFGHTPRQALTNARIHAHNFEVK